MGKNTEQTAAATETPVDVAALHKDREGLVLENAALKSQLEARTAERDEARSEHLELSNKVGELRSECNALITDRGELESVISELRRNLNAAWSRLDDEAEESPPLHTSDTSSPHFDDLPEDHPLKR